VLGVARHRKKDGTIIDVEVAGSTITFGGRPAALVQAVDVTERRRLERQFLRAQRMESIGSLAGGIAHDLNNLLMPILTGATLLKRKSGDEQILRVADNIERSANRGRALVKQVLSFARGIERSRAPVHLGEIVREVRGMIETTFPRNTELVVPVADRLQWTTGDPTQFNQVLLAGHSSLHYSASILR
jgi:signal transduction histidine kinase